MGNVFSWVTRLEIAIGDLLLWFTGSNPPPPPAPSARSLIESTRNAWGDGGGGCPSLPISVHHGTFVGYWNRTTKPLTGISFRVAEQYELSWRCDRGFQFIDYLSLQISRTEGKPRIRPMYERVPAAVRGFSSGSEYERVVRDDGAGGGGGGGGGGAGDDTMRVGTVASADVESLELGESSTLWERDGFFRDAVLHDSTPTFPFIDEAITNHVRRAIRTLALCALRPGRPAMRMATCIEPLVRSVASYLWRFPPLDAADAEAAANAHGVIRDTNTPQIPGVIQLQNASAHRRRHQRRGAHFGMDERNERISLPNETAAFRDAIMSSIERAKSLDALLQRTPVDDGSWSFADRVLLFSLFAQRQVAATMNPPPLLCVVDSVADVARVSKSTFAVNLEPQTYRSPRKLFEYKGRSDANTLLRGPLVARMGDILVVSGCVFAAWGGVYHGSGGKEEVLYAVEVRLGRAEMRVQSSILARSKERGMRLYS